MHQPGPATVESSPSRTLAAHLRPAGRIVGVDVARCLALIGMMATHILPAIDEHGHVPAIQQLNGGRAAALFAVLAGVSLGLVSGRGTPAIGRKLQGLRVGMVVRALVIAVIGLSIGGLDSGVAVILTYYGVLFVLAIPFLGLRFEPLLVLACTWVIAGPVLSYVIRPHLPAFTGEVPSFESLGHPLQLLSDITFGGYYPTVPWLAYIFVGMALGRLPLSKPSIAWRITLIGAVVTVVSWSTSWVLIHQMGGHRVLVETLPPDTFVSRWPIDLTLVHGFYGNTPTTSWWWQAVVAPHSTTPFDLAYTIGTSMVVLGLALLAGRLLPRTLSLVFAGGTMTLTLYSLHVVALGLDWGPDRGMALYVGQVIIALAAAAIWRAFLGSGPLEWLVTYLSKNAAAAVADRHPTVTSR